MQTIKSSTRQTTAIWLVLVVLLSACAAPRVSTVPARPAPVSIFDPAGDWEYVDRGQSILLSLDAEGSGDYAWKEGRIITTAIEGSTWTGIWQQPANDREGGFELTLSSDRQRADGVWWYTRIGENTDPERKGGEFSLIRLPDVESEQAGTSGR